MPNNLKVGPNSVVAKAAVSFLAAGITDLICAIIYKVGDPMQSYVPGRSFNQISGFEVDEGYYMVMLAAADLTAYVVPPIASSSSAYLDAPFTGTSGSNLSGCIPTVGPAFTEFDGTWEIQSNKAVNIGSAPTSTQWVALANIAGKTDVKITAIVNTMGTAGFQIWLRASGITGTNCILLNFGQVTTSGTQDWNIIVYNIVSGTATAIVPNQAAVQDNPISGDLTVVVTLIANSLTVSMNGTNYITNQTIPTTQANTRFGIGANGTGAVALDVKFDSFKVENPAP